jgi:hypothetical protein
MRGAQLYFGTVPCSLFPVAFTDGWYGTTIRRLYQAASRFWSSFGKAGLFRLTLRALIDIADKNILAAFFMVKPSSSSSVP